MSNKRIKRYTKYTTSVCAIVVLYTLSWIFWTDALSNPYKEEFVLRNVVQAREMPAENEIQEYVLDKPYEVSEPQNFMDYIYEVSALYDFPAEIVIAVIEKESRFTLDIGSNNGYAGPMQLSEYYNSARAAKLGVTNLADPYGNVLVGVNLLDELFEKYKDPALALMVYNGGEAYAYQNYNNGVITQYASSILQRANSLKED